MLVIKIGGGESIDLDAILSDLSTIEGPFIIVHGANAFRDELAEKLGVEKEIITSVSGHTSVKSTTEMIDLMLMSYAGVKNKRVVEKLQQAGFNAIGLTGADGGMIQGKRNRGIKARKGGKRVLVRDYSGKPQAINIDLLTLLTDHSYIPVLTVPILDEHQHLINSENDDIVRLLCNSMAIDCVIMFIEEPGLMRNLDDPTSLVTSLNHQELEEWEQEVDGRMKRKLYAIRKMLNESGPEVVIADGRIDQPVQHALRLQGTHITW